MTKIFEITTHGQTLTSESRKKVADTMLRGFQDITFEGGTNLCNPIHLATSLKDEDYILFIEPAVAGKKDELTLLEANDEIRNWLRSRPHDTSYGAIEAYINEELAD